MIKTALVDVRTHPLNSYRDERLRELAEQNLVTSFEYLIPYSDSLVVISKDTNLMVKQLSQLLISCFRLTAAEYQNVREGEDPTIVRRPFITYQGEGDDVEENWYPTLFRGGIAFGNVAVDDGLQLLVYNPKPAKLVSGEPLIEAYQLESSGIKGPRLLCSAAFHRDLDEETSRFVVPYCEGNTFEILWPAFMYINDNNPEIELNDFAKLYLPAEVLWKAYRNRTFGEHYLQFIIIIIRGTLEFFRHKNYYEQAKSYIRDKISEQELLWILDRY